MTEASRYLSEYGDLSRLPLFSQSTNGSTPAAANAASAPSRPLHANWASRRPNSGARTSSASFPTRRR